MDWEKALDSALPVVDTEAMGRLRGLMADVSEEGEDLARDLIDTFRSDVRQRAAAFERALAGGDLDGAAEAVHALKGASATVGAPRMTALCALVERELKAGRPPEGATERIRREADDAAKALEVALG